MPCIGHWLGGPHPSPGWLHTSLPHVGPANRYRLPLGRFAVTNFPQSDYPEVSDEQKAAAEASFLYQVSGH